MDPNCIDIEDAFVVNCADESAAARVTPVTSSTPAAKPKPFLNSSTPSKTEQTPKEIYPLTASARKLPTDKGSPSHMNPITNTKGHGNSLLTAEDANSLPKNAGTRVESPLIHRGSPPRHGPGNDSAMEKGKIVAENTIDERLLFGNSRLDHIHAQGAGGGSLGPSQKGAPLTSSTISHSQSHDAVLSRDTHLISGDPQSASGSTGTGAKLPHKNLLIGMEDQAILMKTRMRSLSLPYALKVKSPETIAKESGSVWRSIFLSPKGFLVVLCVAILAQSMLVSGYIPSIITTIQKRFQFSSKRTGMIISSYDIANLCMVPVVSYFGAKGRRPLWLCMGAMLIFIAAIGFTMPYFLSPTYQVSNSTANSSISDTLCHGGGMSQTIADQAKFFELFYFHKGPSTSECSGGPSVGHDGTNNWPSLTFQSWPFYVFLISLCAFGIGSTPFYTLGTAYLHDNSPEEVVSVYVGILYAMGALGPAIGFLIGALFISFYEDPFMGPPPGISEGDLAWVGAWWGGIIIGAVLIFVFGITLFFFPKQILFKKEKKEESEKREKSTVVEEKAEKLGDDSACYSYDPSHSLEEGECTEPTVSTSTWGTGSVTSSCITSDGGRGSCGSPEVFSNNTEVGAGRLSPYLQAQTSATATPLKSAVTLDPHNNTVIPKTTSPAGRDAPSSALPDPTQPNMGPGPIVTQSQHQETDDLRSLPLGMDSDAPKTVLFCWTFIHSFLLDLFSILFNPVWFLLTMFTVGEVIVVDAFIVFGPKYIQTVFNVDASSANILAGVVMVPSAVIGMIMGGYLIRRLRLSLRGQLWFLVTCAVTSLCAVFGLMFVSCTNVKIAGFNIGYDTREPDMNVTVNYLPKGNLTSHCNLNCDCDDHWYEPVCGANQKTYFNPCYAGCQDLKITKTPEGTTIWNYTQCSCVYSDIEYRHHGFDHSGANIGRCHQPCYSIYVFLLIFAIAVFSGCCAQSPVLVITLGTVDENMKSFALGLQYFMQRGMAYIPTPIYFGYIIDSTCLIWQWNCDNASQNSGHDTRGLCLEYDRKRLPPTMFGSSFVVKTLGLFFLVVCAIRTRRTPTSDAADPKAQAVVTHGQHESPEVPSPGGAGVNSVTPPGGDPSSSKGVSSVERTSSSKSGFRTSRRALFRHKKLEDVYSEDEDDVFESRTEPRDGKAREVSKETSPVHQLKNSARKGDSSVQYNRMRSQSDVDISITNHSFDI